MICARQPPPSLAVTVPGQLASGYGSYNVPSLGATSFGFVVSLAPGPKISYVGQLDVVTPGKWMFQANVTSFGLTSSTQGLLGGTGNLYWWDSALNKGHGAWTLAKSGVSTTPPLTLPARPSQRHLGSRSATPRFRPSRRLCPTRRP